MKKIHKKAKRHQVSAKPVMTAVNQVETPSLPIKNMPIKVFDVEGNLFIHSYKKYGHWKRTEFIHALEDIQENIIGKKYKTIEDCHEALFFSELSIDDQLVLTDIANWYLFNVMMNEREELRSLSNK